MFMSFFLLLTQVWAGESSDIDILVKGMVCSFCVQGVEKKFSAETSVEKVEVNLEESQVSLWLKEKSSLSDEKIHVLIQSAGYNVEKIERKENPSKEQQ